MGTTTRVYRLTRYAHGGGCACKIPPGDWVRPATDLSTVDEAEALLLAGAQTSGGLLLAGEMPGAPVIGELVPRDRYGGRLIAVR
jgi:selenophosphate synthase